MPEQIKTVSMEERREMTNAWNNFFECFNTIRSEVPGKRHLQDFSDNHTDIQLIIDTPNDHILSTMITPTRNSITENTFEANMLPAFDTILRFELTNEYAGKIVKLFGGHDKFVKLQSKMEEMQKLVTK